MDIKEIRKHGHGVLYWIKKEQETLAVPFVADNMQDVLSAYTKMWNKEPYTIERGSQADVVLVRA